MDELGQRERRGHARRDLERRRADRGRQLGEQQPRDRVHQIERVAELAEMGERLKTEPGVRVVVLSGEGSSFCAGLDFASFQMMSSGDRPAPTDDGNPGAMKDGRITHLGQQVCWVWQEIPVPVIAAAVSA